MSVGTRDFAPNKKKGNQSSEEPTPFQYNGKSKRSYKNRLR